MLLELHAVQLGEKKEKETENKKIKNTKKE